MRLSLLALLCALCVSVVGSSFADDPVIARLRQHGDYPAVERYCREKLKSPGLTLDLQADLIAELAGSLAQQANADSDADHAGKHWAECDQLLRAFIEKNPKHSRTPLLLRQQVIYGFARGESLRRSAEASRDMPSMALARRHLERVAELGMQLDRIVRQALDAYNAKASRIEFKDLTALSNDVPYRLGQVYLSLARTHRPQSAEQTRALTEASKRFEFYTREGYSDDEGIVRGHLALAECRRLLKDYDGAVRVLALVELSKTTTLAFKDEALAIRMHALLDQKQPQPARALLEGRAKLTADLALANLRALMLEAQQHGERKDQAGAGRLQTSALRAAMAGDQEFGGSWMAAADRMLADHGSADWLEADASAGTRLGEAFERQDSISPAIAAFAHASERLRLGGKKEAAFDAGLRSAKLRLGMMYQGHTAVQPLRQLLRDAPSNEKAGDVSLLLAYALSSQSRDTALGKDDTQLRDHLREHIRRFPTHRTTPEVHLFAGYDAARRANQQEAIVHFAAVPVSSAHFRIALTELVDSHLALRTKAPADEIRRLGLGEIAHLDRCTEEAPTGPGGDAIRASIRLARSQLLVWPGASPTELAEAQRLLEEVRDLKTLTDSECRRVVRTLVLACIGGGDLGQAERLVPRLSAEELQRLRADLKPWSNRAPKTLMMKISMFEVIVIERLLQSGNLHSDERLRLDTERAGLLARLGRADESRIQLATLRREHPRDAVLAEESARILMRIGTERDYTDAAGHWQALTVSHPEGSEKWLEAKYQLAACYAKLGQKERALKVLRLTLDLWLDDTENDDVRKRYRAQFRTLEANLSK